MSNKNNHSISLVFILMIFALSMTLVHAQQYDQNYLKWKEKQQLEDEKLKKQGKLQSTPNHYLSRPEVKQELTGKSGVVMSSKININTASIEQLQQLNGVGLKKAQAIIDYRSQHGKFKSIDELINVKGFGPKLFEKNKALIRI